MRNLIFVSTLFISSAAAAQDYSSVAGLSGEALKAGLHELIDDHKYFEYTTRGNNDWYDKQKMDVWEALVWTDAACGGAEPCDQVHLLYLDSPRKVAKANRGPGGSDSWEREHVWPKSRGFPAKKTHGYTDLHHLRPADRNINGKHSNYGYFDGTLGTVDVEEVIDKDPSGDTPSGALINTTADWFEPTDAAKGQIARMIFYMDVRYDGRDTATTSMPDLKIAHGNAREKEPFIGDLCTLLDWNSRFPVAPIEIQRNARIEQIQGNRNPFIDNPAFADAIWGANCTP